MDVFKKGVLIAYAELFRALIVEADHDHPVRSLELWKKERDSWISTLEYNSNRIGGMLELLIWALATGRHIDHPSKIVRKFKVWSSMMRGAKQQGTPRAPEPDVFKYKSTMDDTTKECMSQFKKAIFGEELNNE